MIQKKLYLLLAMTLLSAAVYGCGSKTSGNNSAASANSPVEASANGAASANGTAANAPGGSAADAAASGSEAKISVQHEWGTAEFAQVPQRIVTLDFSFIDTLTSLGVTPVGNAGVGTTKVPEYLQDKVTGTEDVGERKAPNLEVIQSLNPDLIIASVDRHSMIRQELSDIAPTVAFDDASYEQILDNVESIGKILGKQTEAEQVVNGLKEKIDAVHSQIEGKPTLVVAGYFDDEFTVWVKDSFIGSLLSQVGVDYAFNGEVANLEGKGEGAKVTLERLHELNPDYILVYGDNTDKLKTNPLYQDLKAVKDQHFISVDRNLWSRGRGPIAADKILDELLAILSGKSVS